VTARAGAPGESAARIILASGSPRRRDLLAKAGFRFETVRPHVAEIAGTHLTARELTVLNATRKGLSVARAHPECVVIAGDTLVTLENEVIGKPAGMAEAMEILRRLSGRVHEVCSAVFLGHLAKARVKLFCEVSQVRFRRLSDGKIRRYLARVDPLDKAGAYAAQGHGAEIILELTGSFSNVVGLPMEQTVEALRGFGVLPLPAQETVSTSA
jgi:nucleoside triphosphate pyrophosphatase